MPKCCSVMTVGATKLQAARSGSHRRGVCQPQHSLRSAQCRMHLELVRTKCTYTTDVQAKPAANVVS